MADLTICGAGIFGLSLAWLALRRGARVTVIDPNGPGAGASGGIVGALQPHTPDPWNEKKQFQFESLSMAAGFWAEVETTSGMSSGYARVGRLQPLQDARDVALAQARAEPARRNWRGAAAWEVVDPSETSGWHPPSATGLYLRDTLSAILNPRLATASLAAAIVARGGVIAAEAPLSEPVIWATGWRGLQDLGRDLGRSAGGGVKGQAILLDHNAAGAPQIYADGLHIVPHLDGTVAIGSTSERDFTEPDTTDALLDEIHERATSLLPILHGAGVRARWAGVRPRAQSRAPLLGPWPGRPEHYIANGGFKIGFGMAPGVARVMSDLLLDGRDAIPDAFRVDASL